MSEKRTWVGHPAAPYIDRLVEALDKREYLPPKTVPGWIVNRSRDLYREAHGNIGGLIIGFRQRVRWLSLRMQVDVRASRYHALILSLYSHPDLLIKLINDTPRGRMCLFRMSPERGDIRHFIALAKLYVAATRSEKGECHEDQGTEAS